MNINKLLKGLKKYRDDAEITIEEVRNIMQTNEEAILLDVRSPQEYKEGHLERSNKHTIVRTRKMLRL